MIQTDVTYPNGAVRRVTFNPDGYATSDTFALNQPEQQTVSYERHATSDLPTAVVDPLNRRTEYAYDTAGNVTSVTRLAGTANAVATTFTYEPTWNQVASVTDPLSHTTNFAYDTAGNLTTVTDPLSHATTFTYNAKGQPLTVTDALSNTTTFGYDPDWGDLVSVTDPLSRTVTRYFDHAGRLVQVTDPLGKSSRTEYDLLNQVTKVIDPLAGETSFTYDLNGNLLSVTDTRSNTTSYTYDNMDRLATRTDPLTRVESYDYDLSGNLTQHIDRRGKVTNYTHDKLDRMTFAGFGTQAGPPPQYESAITYTYDTASRLTQVVDSVSGTIQLSYDDLDRLTDEVTPQGIVNYTYDAAGRRTSMTASGQSQTSYTYDNADRVTQITRGTQTVQFAYDSANRRTALTLPNGIMMSYAHDVSSQLTGITYTLGANQLGNLSYGYDDLGRRVNMGGSFARTNLPLALSSATYDAANQITQWGGVSLTYDANGNLLNDGTKSLTWNARNQLTSISGSISATFQYDASGRRASKTVGGVTTGFLHDGLNPVQEQFSGGVNAHLLAWGIDEFFTRTDQLGAHSFLTDALGSSVALADSSGALLNQYTYEPFGNSSVSGSVFNSFQYTGRENDGTGLFYYRARYYSPTLQRFISQDPIGLAGGLNLYVYSGNQPTFFTDPTGLCRDPGGPGMRYCIETFIPDKSALAFKGDDRGPNSSGGTFRTQQLIFQKPDGSMDQAPRTGISRLGPLEREGDLHGCFMKVTNFPLGGRKIRVACGGSDGLAFRLAPPAVYALTIFQAPNGATRVTDAVGTTFPSIEVWQYGGPNGPRLIYHYDSKFYGTSALDLGGGVKRLPLQ